MITSSVLVAQETQCPRNATDCPGLCGLFIDKNGDSYCDIGNLSRKANVKSEKETIEKAKTVSQKRPYHLIPISVSLFALYIVSLILVKVDLYRKATHRKIWNIGLIVAFLVSAISGILLAIFINNQAPPENYRLWLKYHVDFGIAMTIISVFHILWHLNYFKTILVKKRQ